mgnify:CR=1 FL=1
MTDRRSIVIHGHFYQPPRENPATGLVPVEASAAPDHDWNARITRQCYAPLTAARVGSGASARQLNAFAWLSFDVGPTLLDWMEREAPETVTAIIAADRESARRLGHGPRRPIVKIHGPGAGGGLGACPEQSVVPGER